MICYLSKWGVKCLSIFTLLFNVAALTETHERSYYEQRGEILWEVPVQKKVIALTFDDGPHKEISPQILDLLKQYDAPSLQSNQTECDNRAVLEYCSVCNNPDTNNAVLLTSFGFPAPSV